MLKFLATKPQPPQALPPTNSKIGRRSINFEDSVIFQDAKKQVVKEIDETLKLLGINRSELSKRLDMQASAVTQALRKDKGMQLTTLVRIADVIGCDVEINLIRRTEIQLAEAVDA